MTFFTADTSFLEFDIDPKTINEEREAKIGPITFDFDFDDFNKTDQVQKVRKFNDYEGTVQKPYLYHKFTNYSIIEASTKHTGVRSKLFLDFLNG